MGFIRYLVVNAEGTAVTRKVDVPVGYSPMVHDIHITESSVLLLDFPCRFNLERAMEGHQLPYVGRRRARRAGVLLDGTADDVRWCEVDPCYVFHPLNAFDLPDGRIQMEVARHPAMFRKVTNGPAEGEPTLDRWTLDPATGRTIEERLDDRSHEFLGMTSDVSAEQRYGYTVGFVGDEGPGYKHDLVDGTIEVHDFGPGCATQEMVFVPRSRRLDRQPVERGRRLDHELCARRDDRHGQRRDPRRPGLQRRAGRHRPPAPAGAVRLSWQLGAHREVMHTGPPRTDTHETQGSQRRSPVRAVSSLRSWLPAPIRNHQTQAFLNVAAPASTR